MRKPEVKKEAETSVCWESSRRPTVFLQLHVKISSNILKEEFFRTSIHRSKFENLKETTKQEAETFTQIISSSSRFNEKLRHVSS